MSDFYDYILHKDYQYRINNQINIKEKIFKAIDIYKNLLIDDTNYPFDQDTLHVINFPLSDTRAVPALVLNDYIICLNNYRTCGDLFTIRYVNPTDKYCEAIFLDPNDKGQTWLLIIGTELGDIEQVKKGTNINLMIDDIENIYH
jgi:hypothetical protein